ncbi:MAG: DUF3822 family protein [Bacteroidetes bacterium]|nr:DUF3822 family protein [Bacteroidota bacterium]
MTTTYPVQHIHSLNNIAIREYSLADIESADLNIHVYHQSIVFSVYQPQKNAFIGFVRYQFEQAVDMDYLFLKLKLLKSTEELLNFTFKKKIIHIATNGAILIPSDFFHKDAMASLYEFNFTKKYENYFTISVGNIEVISGLTYRTKLFLDELFGSYETQHIAYSLLTYFQKIQVLSTTSSSIFLHMIDGSAFIIAYDGGKLIFYNQYFTRNEEDMLYYILAVYEQLQLNTEHHELVLSGWIDTRSDMYKLMFKYIRNISFAKQIFTKHIPPQYPLDLQSCFIDVFNSHL